MLQECKEKQQVVLLLMRAAAQPKVASPPTRVLRPEAEVFVPSAQKEVGVAPSPVLPVPPGLDAYEDHLGGGGALHGSPLPMAPPPPTTWLQEYLPAPCSTPLQASYAVPGEAVV